MTTFYAQPEKFGLELVASHDIDGGYQYDMVCVWRNVMTGQHYIGHDRGCSCPAPFEWQGLDDLDEVHTLADVADYAREAWSGRSDFSAYLIDNEVARLVDGLVLDKGGAA